MTQKKCQLESLKRYDKLGLANLCLMTASISRPMQQVELSFYSCYLLSTCVLYTYICTCVHQAREIEEGVSAKLGEGAMFFAQVIGGVVVGFYYSWDVALVACATAPPCTAGLYFLTKITSETAAKLTAAYSKAGGVALETIYNMRTVASLQCEGSKSCESLKKYIDTSPSFEPLSVHQNF